MMRAWRCTLHVTQHETKLLLSSPEQGDLLKARLDSRASHLRALLTLLEGLSLWKGQLLYVALHVDERCLSEPGSMLLGDELWPAESALVRFELAHRGRQHGRPGGLGDFRAVRKGAL